MTVLSDTKCRANQGDLSVFKGSDGRMWMLQSIDRPVDQPDCTAKDTATTTEEEGPDGQWRPAKGPDTETRTRARFGYEGLRLFDVTNPAAPQYKAFFRTECGSHTHTLVPDPKRGRVHAYIASYPLGAGITPQVDYQTAGDLRCDAPHRKISIVSFPLGDPTAGTVKTQPLSADTEPYDPDGPPRQDHGAQHGNAPGFQACHDHQAFMPRDVTVASCAGDAQYWDISKPAEPSSNREGKHTHIKRENGTTESFDFIHNAVVTWDGKLTAITDESGGGVEARCDGDQSKRGFTFFYPLVKPGKTVDGFGDLRGRYMIPRPQKEEICVSHNGSVLPTEDGRYLYVQAFYQGGNTLYEFTNPAKPAEIGFADLEDATGCADSWSTYWYRDTAFVNGGLNRRAVPGCGPTAAANTGNRGFEAYRVRDRNGKAIDLADWAWSNPQTQEEFQVPDEDQDEDEDEKD